MTVRLCKNVTLNHSFASPKRADFRRRMFKSFCESTQKQQETGLSTSSKHIGSSRQVWLESHHLIE